jgi:hypothetical protein
MLKRLDLLIRLLSLRFTVEFAFPLQTGAILFVSLCFHIRRTRAEGAFKTAVSFRPL